MDILDIEQERIESYHDLLHTVNNIRNANLTLEALDNDVDANLLVGYTNTELSTESNLNDEYKTNLKDVNKDIVSFIERKFKKFHSVSEKSHEYKIEQLINYRNDIANGDRVIDVNITKDDIDKLSNKLGVFIASGYSLRKGSKDLITFISGINSLLKRNSKYLNSIINMGEQLRDYKTTDDIDRSTGVTNMKKKFSNIVKLSKSKLTFTDYRFSIPTKWISKNVEFNVVKYNSKVGLKVGLESYRVTSKVYVGEPNEKDILKLLDMAIEQKNVISDVYAVLNLTINRLIKLYTVELIKGETNSRFLLSRYCENSIETLLNNYNDMLAIDDLVRLYISKTTKRKNKV